ncbi:MAG: TetR family transcriptional regulator [Acidimicrobiia bacterium]
MSQVGAAEFSGAASADVAHTDGDACTVRRKVGRPPRLDREMIARAASEIGLDHVTMKAVAEKLGVSVPALYHHVDGRADLMQLATEYSTRVMQLPADRGQHWAEWLMEWARYAFETFTQRPEFLYQVQRGVFGVDRMVVQVDAMIATLTAQGFNEVDALEAWNLANRVAVGASVNAIRQRDLANDRIGSYHRVLADRASDELPNLRRLVNALEQSPPRTLDDEIATALIGIAAQRGEPWEQILDFRRPSHAATQEPTAH